MLRTFLENEIFINLMKNHVKETLNLLFKEGIHFSILANVSEVEFDPALPEHISHNFKPITVFFLAGYTFESANIQDDSLVFEAGFGQENIGSLVTMPLGAILQIVIEDTPVLINLSIPKTVEKKKDGGVEKSMEALLSNPENKKLFKEP